MVLYSSTAPWTQFSSTSGVEEEFGALGDAGLTLGLAYPSGTPGQEASGYSINFGLGKYLGVSITPRTALDRCRSVFNPGRYIEGISFGFGLG